MLGGFKFAEAYLLPPKAFKRKKKKPPARPLLRPVDDEIAEAPTKRERRLKIAEDIIKQHNKAIERFLSGVGR